MYGEDFASLRDQPPWFVKLWKRFRPTTGWGVFWLSVGCVVLLPIALVSGGLIPGLDAAVALAIVAFVFWGPAQ